jgi:ubiquinone/menaquinone biosynthesis C-methylase UbiE
MPVKCGPGKARGWIEHQAQRYYRSVSDSRKLVQQQFGRHAERYVNSSDHSRGESLDRLLALVAPRHAWRVLDIATGGGHTALAFAPHVESVIASDLTPEMLRAARKFIREKGHTHVRFAAADAGALPWTEGAFDLVTCRVAPHHFADCGAFVREMFRVLKTGGVAAMIDNVVPEDPAAADYINAFEKLRDPSHQRALTDAEWLRVFEHVGFEIQHRELFRKPRGFEFWSDMQGLDAATKVRLQQMLLAAPPPARAALAPEYTAGGKLQFYLTELLLIAIRV